MTGIYVSGAVIDDVWPVAQEIVSQDFKVEGACEAGAGLPLHAHRFSLRKHPCPAAAGTPISVAGLRRESLHRASSLFTNTPVTAVRC